VVVGIIWLGVLGLMLILMEFGIAGRVMGLGYINRTMNSGTGGER
jgi:hypothetical protein